MAPIVTLTMNPALDVSTETPEVRPSDKLRCAPPHYQPGGGGINVARVITALGGRATPIFPVGGPSGDLLCALLLETGIAFEAVRIAGATRESFTVDERSTGRQYRFVLPGPTVTGEEQAHVLEAIAALPDLPDYIVASGSLPPGVAPDFYARLGRAARRIGARFILDCPGEVLAASAGAGALLIKPNLLELEAAAGHPLADDRARITAARALITAGVAEAVVISRGVDGALLVTAGEATALPADLVPVRSTVGAGDSMVGAITLGLARGEALHAAVRYGMAAGAAAVMSGASELAHREDTERLLQEAMVRAAVAPA